MFSFILLLLLNVHVPKIDFTGPIALHNILLKVTININGVTGLLHDHLLVRQSMDASLVMDAIIIDIAIQCRCYCYEYSTLHRSLNDTQLVTIQAQLRCHL